MARKMKSRSGSAAKSTEPVKLTNRLAGAFVGGLMGFGVGMFMAQKVLLRTFHINDSRIWVLTCAGCAIALGIVGFFTAPANLEWNKPIEPHR